MTTSPQHAAGPPAWSVVWITGASSGIGKALALELARQGSTVAASARTASGLRALCDEALGLPGRIMAFPVNVVDDHAMRATCERIESELGPIDLAVLNAGTYLRNDKGAVSADLFRVQMEVNVMGVVNGLEPLLEAFARRASGHIAVVASLSGYRGLPRASAYGATKAALINLCEALKIELYGTGVAISLINPGFVETPLTDKNDFPMPFLMPVDKAVDAIMTGLRKRRFEIAFPKRLAIILKIARCLPYALYFRLVRRATGT